ncbi:DRTGG domain-containing protein [Solidesulfovibrio sp.]|uniref:phosphotransacetylase family protein n=1 Tax=Solidesulfovibrio sp. TaxID=2910990 RepID=UPI00261D89A3|nr:DRTGG domain-containing protein [Solidesulfovibrio sp.]
MIGLYIGSTQGYSGKNLVTLALGQQFQREGLRVGYMKPIGAVPHKVENQIGDEDAHFMQQALGLSETPSLVTPVVITRDFRMRAFLEDCANLLPGIVDSYKKLSTGKDLMLVGGSGSFLYSGKYCGVDGVAVAQALGTKVVLVDRYLQDYNYDYLAAAKEALGDDLAGVILNDVPEHFREEAETLIVPFLKRRGVDVLGIIPHDPIMFAVRAGDLANGLGGRLITSGGRTDSLVVNFLIGTMQVENFVTFFKRHKDVAILCGGDRADLQLVALEGGCAALILTGNLYPNDIILAKAEDKGIPVIVVRDDTFSVAKKMELMLTREKLRDRSRIEHGAKLVQQAVNMAALKKNLGI